MDRYPIDVLPPRDIDWRAIAQVVTGGQSVSGFTQSARLDGGGFWACTYSEAHVSDEASLAAHVALEARLDGGAAPIIVPRPRTPSRLLLAPHSDYGAFSDGGLYQCGSTAAVAALAASLRATTLRVQITAGVLGPYFTIDHATVGPRYYAIARQTDLGGSLYDLEIRTPLREAVSLGEALDFDDPRCVMRLADPESIRLPLQYNRWAAFSPVFVEYFDQAIPS